MRNTIQNELELAERKKIEEIPFQGKNLAKLTCNNVAIVEAMILFINSQWMSMPLRLMTRKVNKNMEVHLHIG